jgi:hypothetical protein
MSGRVLVVDDNSLVCEGLRFMLTHLELHATGWGNHQYPFAHRLSRQCSSGRLSVDEGGNY